MNKTTRLIICIAIPLIVGGIAGYVTASSINTWYVLLKKPWFNPPNYLFGPVWTVLYVFMGISLFQILETPKQKYSSAAVAIFGVQLFLNFAWSILFFRFQQIAYAAIDISLLWMSIVAMIILFFQVNVKAALLQIPYLLWVSFAFALNLSIWSLNS